MKFLNLLIPKEKIVGIEIGAQKLKMLFLEKDISEKISVAGKSEVELEEGVIVFGAVKNKEKLSKALFKLKKIFSPGKNLSSFAVVTISQSGIYSEILEFPKYLDSEQLLEAISMNAAEKLPLRLSECYLDWQVIESGANKNKVLVSLIPRKIADDYIDVLKENGFNLIALEASFLSIERAVNVPKDPIIFLYFTDEGITSIVYYNKFSYFSQFELWQEASLGKEIKNIEELGKIIKNKIKKIVSYFESQYEPLRIKKVFLMSYGFDAEKIIKKIGPSGWPMEKAEPKVDSLKNSDWVPVTGAALRAFIPRSDDTIISLLPVGTESLYETQKAISFAKSIFFLISALASFYVIAFMAVFVFVSFLGSGINRQMELRSNIPLPTEYLQMEAATKEFNGYVNDLSVIHLKTKDDYAAALSSIAKLNIPGISLTGLNFDNLSKPISISGIAANRESLGAFKLQMEKFNLFNDINFSVQNIAQKSNIPFSASLYLKKL